ncbi:cytochrome d ubiquinol oxidase subunit II [Bacteroidota bacterium]
MFESLSYLVLQQYWWILIAVLGSLLVFLMFVQGGQTMIYQIGKTESQRSMLINSIGRKWDLTFTTLVTFGGAFFASFPLFYSTSFGGAYWVWMLILFSFVIQAVSYEFRSKPNNFLGKKTFDIFLFINGLLGTILIGAAVGTFFTGSEFSIDKLRITEIGAGAISRWENPFHGLEAALNITNLSLGLLVLFVSRILGGLYFINSVDDNDVYNNSKRHLIYNIIPFVVFLLLFLVLILTKDGFAYDPETKYVFMEPNKYLNNFLQMPVILIITLIGIIGVLYGLFISVFKNSKKGIWFTGPGVILFVFSLFAIAGFNNTAYYPSTYDLQSSLTIENSSSSEYTLTAMSYVSLILPLVVAYIWYIWRKMSKKKIDKNEIKVSTDI